MPQMAPLMWLSLFLFFSFLFLVFMSVVYFMTSPIKMEPCNNSMKIYNFNWKW
uniref:ATP synthase F0 subunit 8 n=1 Tax=Amphionides reynaudii TaxID=1727191 RepID=UPI0021D52D5C|nr:ATP synthase F0 subunit 8 [Amphionides reynaudii]UXG18826.1 ATP synthase F0 subunit 8 [Amphionides reynaudii]